MCTYYCANICTCQHQKRKLFHMISDRLRLERERLKFTQSQLADITGATRRTIVAWEKGDSSPTAVQLSSLSTIGFDTQYIITGQRKTVLEELGEQGYLPGQACQDVLKNIGFATNTEDSFEFTEDDIELITRFHQASFKIKAEVMQLLSQVELKSKPVKNKSTTKEPSSQSSQTFNAPISGGDFAARDIVNHGRTRKK